MFKAPEPERAIVDKAVICKLVILDAIYSAFRVKELRIVRPCKLPALSIVGHRSLIDFRGLNVPLLTCEGNHHRNIEPDDDLPDLVDFENVRNRRWVVVSLDVCVRLGAILLRTD